MKGRMFPLNVEWQGKGSQIIMYTQKGEKSTITAKKNGKANAEIKLSRLVDGLRAPRIVNNINISLARLSFLF